MPVLNINAIPAFRKPVHLHRTKKLTGQRFGRLLALALLGMSNDEKHRATWLFRCDCGNLYYCPTEDVIHNRTISCGCFQRETQNLWKTRFITHGMRHTKTYDLWCHVIDRTVTASDDLAFKNYAGRGITVCQYLRRFEGFLALLGECPPNKSSTDRIDPNGHYSCGTCNQCLENRWPLNVRWADKWEQAANRRSNHYLTIGSETYHMAEWSRRRNIPHSRIIGRLRLGWTAEEALEFVPRQTPTKSKNYLKPKRGSGANFRDQLLLAE